MANKHTLTEAANIAAKWWRNLIEDQKSDVFSNEEHRNTPVVLKVKGWFHTEKKRSSPEAYDLFQEALSAQIIANIEKLRWNSLSLECNNGPDEILTDAAEIAGIDTTAFPLKQRMIIKRHSCNNTFTVSVFDGYEKSL